MFDSRASILGSLRAPALCRPAAACLALAALYALAQPSRATTEERQRRAAAFRFERSTLPRAPGATQSMRTVHPSLAHLAAWISATGAAIALHDMDGDGVANDAILVDPRTDTVQLCPVPGSDRYAPLVLYPGDDPISARRADVAPMGALPCDVDENGRADVLVYFWGRPPLLYLRTDDSDLRYRCREIVEAADAAAAGPVDPADPDRRWFTNAAALADCDGDGHLDVLIGNYFPDGARVLDATAGGVETMQSSMSNATNGGRNRLLLWSRRGADVGFVEAAGVFDDAIACGWTLALGAADLDGDLLPEVYVANDFGPDRLLHNRSTPGKPRFAVLHGAREFATPKSRVVGRDSFKGMGVDFGDLNRDGVLDIVVSNITCEFGLQESNFAFLSTGDPAVMADGIAPYVDRSESLGLARSGWGWDLRLGDFDCDGTLEILQATGFVRGAIDRWSELQELATVNDAALDDPRSWPRFLHGTDLDGRGHGPFFARMDDGRFADLAAEIGLDAPVIGRGLATGDIDADGDLDVAVAAQWQDSFVLVNVAPDPGAALVLDLLLPIGQLDTTEVHDGPPRQREGRPAVGAFARVRTADGRLLVAAVDGGSGHSGKRSPELHFGLGAANSPATVELEWRDAFGVCRRDRRSLAPGRHTVRLASCAGRES